MTNVYREQDAERVIILKSGDGGQTWTPDETGGGSGGGGGDVDSVDGRTGDVTLTDLYQPLDADLTAIAAVSTTAYGRALLALANAAALRTAAALGTIAVQDANSVSITGGSITGITDLAIADGGTGASSASAAFNALAPTTTRGDFIVRGASGNIRFPLGSQTFIMMAGATDPSWVQMIGDAAIASDGTVTLASTAVTPDTYGDTTHVAQFTVDQKGRLTFAQNVAISAAGSGPFLDTNAWTTAPVETGLPNGSYASGSSNVSYTAPTSNYTVDNHYGWIYVEPALVGSGAIPPFTRTVVVDYSAGNTYMTKTDGSTFLAGDVGAAVASGHGIPAGTYIGSRSVSNTHANLTLSDLTTPVAVTGSGLKHAVSKILTRSSSATGYTGTGALPTLTTQYAINVPPLAVATNNWAAYLAGTTIDGDGNVAAVGNVNVAGNVDIATTGVLIGEKTSGHLLGTTTAQIATSTIEIAGFVHVTTGSLGLHYIATGFSGIKSSLDTRQTNAPSLPALAGGNAAYVTQSGDVIGAWHFGSSGTDHLIDCAQVYLVAAETHSNSKTGNQFELYTCANGGLTKALALKLGNDKKVTVYGSINANSGPLTTDGAFTLTGALSGANNILYTDGTVALTSTVGGTILRWDTPSSGSTGSVALLLDGARVSGGTWAAVQAGDFLAQVAGRGQYDTTAGHQAQGSKIAFEAEATFSSTTNAKSRFTVFTNDGIALTRHLSVDNTGSLHLMPTLTSNLIGGSAFAVKSDGSLWIAPTAYASNQPSAAPATIAATGDAAFQSVQSQLSGARVGDLSKTNNTFADALTFTGLVNAQKYRIRGFLIVDVGAAGATCSYKLDLAATSSFTVSQMDMRVWAINNTSAALAGSTHWATVTSIGAILTGPTAANSQTYMLYLEGTMTASHDGGVKLRFAQNTTNATAALLKSGSHLTIEPISVSS